MSHRHPDIEILSPAQQTLQHVREQKRRAQYEANQTKAMLQTREAIEAHERGQALAIELRAQRLKRMEENHIKMKKGTR